MPLLILLITPFSLLIYNLLSPSLPPLTTPLVLPEITSQITCVHVCAQSCPTLCDPRTAARQAPLSMGFSRHDTGVGCQALLLGILPTRGRSGLLHFRLILYCLSYQRIPVLTCSWYQKLRFSQAAHLYLQIWIILSCLICLT